ncbi:MAG: GTPase Era [Acidobacteriota bacterium]|nr:GTPase Era [Acidobacteriota bacterium]
MSQHAPTRHEPAVAGKFVSGFVTIIGRPNAGKSTLLNAMAGGKLAIVSSKPQTTRTSVQAVVTSPHSQIVFIDTPGIHDAPSLLNRRMMETVRAALQERDVLLFVADCLTAVSDDDRQAVDLIRGVESPVLLVLNKIDRLDDKRQLLPRIEQYQSLYNFAESFPISAAKNEGLDRLRESIVARLPEGPQYFPSDYLTDQPERFLAAELIREKILRETRQEVPHSIAVLVENWEDTPKMIRIAASIYVERAGQKGIVIGAKGAMLKTIGTSARIEIEKLVGRKVFLELFVKVRPDWRQSPEFLNAIDWRSESGTELETDLENR